jgi:mRNA-degrading endonuclease RelE of RelBE toxin-antitoxin system
MLLVETPIFTERVLQVLSDDEYRGLQFFIAQHPEAGDLIPGSSGLRKLRWKIAGKGKRGGTRIIYYWVTRRDTVILIFIFKKSERSDLTKDQLKKLRAMVEEKLE